MNIDINGVSITLTQEQLDKIAEQTRKNKPITERIQTLEDCFKEVGLNRENWMRTYENMPRYAFNSLLLTEVIIPAYNERWVPDWNNNRKEKWYPWFHFGAEFTFYYVDCGCGYSYVGSHFVFKEKELAEDCAKKFLHIFRDAMM